MGGWVWGLGRLFVAWVGLGEVVLGLRGGGFGIECGGFGDDNFGLGEG